MTQVISVRVVKDADGVLSPAAPTFRRLVSAGPLVVGAIVQVEVPDADARQDATRAWVQDVPAVLARYPQSWLVQTGVIK